MKKCKIVLFIIFLNNYLFSVDFIHIKSYMLKNSKELKVKEFDSHIAKSELSIVNSQYYPEISIGFNLESSNSLDNSSSSTSVGGNTLSNDSLQKSYSYVNLNYNLYDFGKLKYQSKSQEYIVESEKYNYCSEKKNIINSLLESYYQARIYQIKEEYLNKIIDIKNEIYNYNKKLFNSGNISKIDFMKSSLDVAQTFSGMSENQKLLYEMLEKISNISTYKFKNQEKLEPLLPVLISNKKSFENTVNAQVLKKQIKSKKAEISYIKKDYLPSINLYSKYDVYGSDESSFSDSIKDLKENSYKAGLNISWNLFNGFKTSSQKQKAILQLKQLKEKYLLEESNFESQFNILNKNHELEQLTLKHKKQSLELSLLNSEYSHRLNKVGEINKIDELSFFVDKYYKELEYKNSEEKIAYEYIKKSILLEDEIECIVD